MRDPVRCLRLLAATVFLAAAQSDEVHVSAHAYTPPQLRLSVQVQLVQLEVVVRDAHGQPVSGLKPSDFEILDEGNPREIAAFSVGTRAGSKPAATGAPSSAANPSSSATPPVPTLRSTLLFFDDLHGAPPELQRAQIAAKQFVKAGLGPGARAAVFAASQGLVLDFTADADALTSAIEKLRPHQRISENGMQPCPRITPYQAYLIDNTTDINALDAAVQEAQQCANHAQGVPAAGRTRLTTASSTNPTVMAVKAQASATWQQARQDSITTFEAFDNALALLTRAPGTRVLLMVSTGFLSASLDADREGAVDRAVRAGIVIDALDAKGLWSETPGRVGETEESLPIETFLFETSTIGSRNDAVNAVMQEFASGTGGLFFHNNNDLVGGFAQLAAVPETTYLIAFRPDEGGAAGKYRKLKVRLTAKSSDYVQTRPGYFAPAAAAPAAAPEVRPLDQQVMAPDVLAQIPIQLTQKVGKTDKGDPTVSLLIHVDLAALKFTQRDGRRVQKLAFVGALLDAGGKLVAAKEGAMDFALKQDTFARLTASGVNAGLTLTAPPGSYRARVVVEDADGKLASLNQAVEIPQ